MHYLTKAGVKFLNEATLKQKIGAGILATGAALGLGHNIQKHNEFQSTHDSGYQGHARRGAKLSPPHDFFTPAPSTQANQGTKHYERETFAKKKLQLRKRQILPRLLLRQGGRSMIKSGVEHRKKMRKIWPQKQVG